MIDIGIRKLGKNRVFKENLRFDVTPEILFKPRFVHSEKDKGLIDETQGFSFYVEYMGGLPKPLLMVMKTYCMRSKTIAQITDAPEDLLWEAVRGKDIKDISGMYPLNGPLAEWIKAQLDAE
ncbi:MAG: hypothetical protein M0033_02740 [Nitrospiraceae bacterium]|nr:hypothetical protein [Nitrospiraceae bacterium]